MNPFVSLLRRIDGWLYDAGRPPGRSHTGGEPNPAPSGRDGRGDLFDPIAYAQARMDLMARELALEMLPTPDSPLYDQAVAEALAADGLAARVEAWLARQTEDER